MSNEEVIELLETQLARSQNYILSTTQTKLKALETCIKQDLNLNDDLKAEIKSIADLSAIKQAQNAIETLVTPIARSESEQTIHETAQHLEAKLTKALQDNRNTAQIWAIFAGGVGVAAAICVYLFN